MPVNPTDKHGGSLSKPQQGPPPSSSRSSEGSPSSLIMARGRSRVRRVSSDADPFSEENLRKRYVSGGTHYLFRICSAFEQAAFFTQWLPQRQVVRPDLPPRKAMEASARDGLWSVRRRHVSARFPRSLCSLSPFVLPSRRPFSMKNLNLSFFFLFFSFSFFFSPYNQSTPISSAQPQMRFRARPSR